MTVPVSRKGSAFSTGDREFESGSLQGGVYCEPDAVDQVSRLAAAYNRGLNRAIREIGTSRYGLSIDNLHRATLFPGVGQGVVQAPKIQRRSPVKKPPGSAGIP
jgi:hypothetical protein